VKSFFKTLLLLIIKYQLSIINCFSQQAPGIEWAKCYGGSYWDAAYAVIQTHEGGYMVVGETASDDYDVSGNHDSSDFWAVKLDSFGNIQWQKCYGGSDADAAFSVIETNTGSFVISGLTLSNDSDVSGNHGLSDYWIIKTDSSGNLLSQNCLGGSAKESFNSNIGGLSQVFRDNQLIQCTDGGIAMIGSTLSNDGDVSGNHGNEDYWVVKLDSALNVQWQKCLGGSGFDFGCSIIQAADGGYAVAGWSESNDGDVTGHHGPLSEPDYWVAKLDSTGNLQWQKSLGGTDRDFGLSIINSANGGFVVCGFVNSNDSDVTGNHNPIGFTTEDTWIVMLDSTGNLQWQKCFGGTQSEWGPKILKTFDGNMAAVSTTYSNNGDVSGNHGEYDYWIIKIDSAQNILFQKCLGGPWFDYVFSFSQTADSGFVLAGWVMSNGADVTGYHDSICWGEWCPDFWVVKLGPDTLTGIINHKSSINHLQIFPNPSNGIFQITFPQNQKTNCTLDVINTLGQTVFAAQPETKNQKPETQLDLSFLPKGIYVLKISDGKEAANKILIIE